MKSILEILTFVKNRFNSATGHYTAIVWAKTYKIGCGYTAYSDGNWNKKLIVCNYGPAGNSIGSPMYQVGQSCSNCPENSVCSRKYSGLCTIQGEAGLPYSEHRSLSIPSGNFNPKF